MDLAKVLADLRQELADLDAAIASLEQFQQDRPRVGRAAKEEAQNGQEARASAPRAAEANGRSRDSA